MRQDYLKIIPIKNTIGELITSHPDIANVFIRFFATIGFTLLSNEILSSNAEQILETPFLQANWK